MFSVEINDAVFRVTVERTVSRVIKDAVYELRRSFAEQFGRIKTGRTYRRPKPLGGTYRASAPGEAPAIRTGNLLRSITEQFPDALTGVLTIAAPYAEYLEKGTSRMAARPFVGPAIDDVVEKFRDTSARIGDSAGLI